MVRNTQKSEKWEINAVGPGLWQEKKKRGKMRNKHLEYDEKYRICLYEKYRIYII